MSNFSKQEFIVSGVRVEVLEAGKGEPIVFLHGAGTGGGFDHMLPLAAERRLIIPVHPGFGGSDDDPRIDSLLDYAVHYAGLFGQLGLDKPVDVIGHSLGGWIASLLASLKGQLVRRLVLACPAGLRVDAHPATDIFMIPPEKFLSTFVSDPDTLTRMASVPVTNEMKVARYREMTSLARIIWDKAYEPKLDRWLAGIAAPTLLLWGAQDKVLPVELAQHWARHIPDATVKAFEGAGHLLFNENRDALEAARRFVTQ
jgi:pimeloyl-ACP methyl ester carboxylesterase